MSQFNPPGVDEKRSLPRNGDAHHEAWLRDYYRDLINREGSSAADEIAKAMAHLHQERIRDPLTGLYNRAFIESIISHQVALMADVKSSLALLMIDVDHFKTVNDTEGHPAGDRALRALAIILRTVLGLEGLAGRYGGEEFIALIPYADEKEIIRVATQIGRAASDKLAGEAELTTPRVTLSIGAALAGIHTPTNELIKYADNLLYKAKNDGRNRLCVADRVVPFG